MFLLGNLLQLGPKLGPDPNSGNYKLIVRQGKTLGVFCMTRRGNLLLSLETPFSDFDFLWNEVSKETLEFKGVLGDWNLVDSLWIYLLDKKHIKSSSIKSKEILYQLSKVQGDLNSNTRRLGLKDFSNWLWLYRAFSKETGLVHQLSDEQLHAAFENFAETGKYWGLFEDGKLVSTATLTTMAHDIGQIGGVFTLPTHRNRGLSKKCISHLMVDSAKLFGLRKMILFTDEGNVSAQKVYERLGFERVGHYGIYFT